MSLNNTPSSERTHIGIFGRRNAGKSSLINALTGQNLAIVSDVRGTTTDPVFKAMELLPLGPVVMIDTPGLDDTGELGKLRIQKAYQVLNKTDIAVLVVDGTTGITPQDNAILTRIQDKKIPLLLVLNKADLYDLVYWKIFYIWCKSILGNLKAALYSYIFPGDFDRNGCWRTDLYCISIVDHRRNHCIYII